MSSPQPTAIGRIGLSLLITFTLSALFLLWPKLDLRTSALFYREDQGFIAAASPILHGLRYGGIYLVYALACILVLLFLKEWLMPVLGRGFGLRPLLHSLLSLLIGPALLVNGIFKEYFGRPRPIHTIEFGGQFPYVPPWTPAAYCQHNCSFVSGEASGAFWLLSLIHLCPPPFRLYYRYIIWCWIITMSVNRLAFGAHFISDVLIAWSLTHLSMTLVAILLFQPKTPSPLK